MRRWFDLNGNGKFNAREIRSGLGHLNVATEWTEMVGRHYRQQFSGSCAAMFILESRYRNNILPYACMLVRGVQCTRAALHLKDVLVEIQSLLECEAD